MGKNTASSVEKILDTDELVKNVRHNLGAYNTKTKDESGRTKVELELFEDHLMNKKGIQQVMTIMRSFIDSNQILSNYDEEKIIDMLISLHQDIATELTLNWENYDINDKSEYNKVVQIITTNAYSTFLRAMDGKTLDKIAEMAQDRSESVKRVEDGRNKSKGLFNRG